MVSTIIDKDYTLAGIKGASPALPEKAAEPRQEASLVSAAGTDRVSLSIGKGEVDRLKKAASEESDFRAEKVAALKKQVAEETYQVDAAAVAAKMMEKLRGGTGGGING